MAIKVFSSIIYPKQPKAEMGKGKLNVLCGSVRDYFLHFKIVSITQSKSPFVIAVPDGKQRRRSNKSSATSPPTFLALHFCFFS